MRLSESEVFFIKESMHKFFGETSSVYLFGSRVDDTQKGGDIDLYIIPSDNLKDRFQRKIAFLVDIKDKIGEQKIDVVIAGDKKDLIDEIAMETGIKL